LEGDGLKDIEKGDKFQCGGDCEKQLEKRGQVAGIGEAEH